MCANGAMASTRKTRPALQLILVLGVSTAIVTTTAVYSVVRVNSPVTRPTALTAQPDPVMHTVASNDLFTKTAANRPSPTTRRQPVYDTNQSMVNANLIKPDHQLHTAPTSEQPSPQPLIATASPQPPPRPKVVRAPPSTRYTQPADRSVWDRLARCESGGNWASNVGALDGGLQFHPRTWRAYGGTQYAPSANRATREQQIAIAERVLAGQGWRAWPACSRKLGLR
jgi:hypothetical protein